MIVDKTSSFVLNTDFLQGVPLSSNIGRSYDKEIEDWLPEYVSIKELSKQPLNIYKELKDHMAKTLSNKPKQKVYVIEWKKNMLSYVNPLGNVIASLSNHFIDSKTKSNSNLTQSCSIAAGNFLHKCERYCVEGVDERVAEDEGREEYSAKGVVDKEV